MPLYEYECLLCGERFEEIRKYSDPPLTEHEDCGGALRKLLSPPAIQFKGSGWYVTDYAKKSEPRDAAKDGGEKKTAAEKGEKSERAEKTEKAKSATSDAKPASSPAKA